MSTNNSISAAFFYSEQYSLSEEPAKREGSTGELKEEKGIAKRLCNAASGDGKVLPKEKEFIKGYLAIKSFSPEVMHMLDNFINEARGKMLAKVAQNAKASMVVSGCHLGSNLCILQGQTC